MNAAIRALTRSARYHDLNVIGIMRGYQGLIEKEFVKFTSSSVSNTIQRGGTILKTARCQAFLEAEGRKKAYDNMVEAGIDAIFVIGGNGTGIPFYRELQKKNVAFAAGILMPNDIDVSLVEMTFNCPPTDLEIDKIMQKKPQERRGRP